MGMLNLFTSLVLMSPGVFANSELDRAEVFPDSSREYMLRQASPEQARLAKALPQTVIVRISQKDPKKMEVAFLRDKISAENVAKVKADFQKLAENSEVRGLAYDSTNELDATSSTSTWGWRPGWGGGGWGWGGGWGRWGGWRPGWGWGGGGWVRPNWGWPAAVVYPTYPSYAYGYGCPNVYYYGYSYPYCPYAGWTSGGYVNVAFRW